jgi:hypothetical protein
VPCTRLYKHRVLIATGANMTIEEALIRKYGPLFSFGDLAEVLDRSPDALRITLRSSNDWVGRINAARFCLGRRVYFRSSEIAVVLDGKGSSASN